MSTTDKKQTAVRISMKIVIPLLLIALGGAAMAYFKNTAPKVKRMRPKPPVTAVDVMPVVKTDAPAIIKAMGTVVPSREITLRARISGEVQSLSQQFTPGGYVAKGEALVTLDPSDYEVALQKAKSSLEKAEADLSIEKGSQTIAREELRLLSETAGDTVTETDLLLRKPQLQQARAAVTSARAELRQTQLNLERTVVKAPFNALVVERNVNLGSHVSTQDSLATLVSTDEYWIEAVVPVDRLSALDFNRKGGAQVAITSQAGNGEWQGTLVRTTGKLSDKSRMATVIIAVPDPLGIHGAGDHSPLILDDYVSVVIQGRILPSVFELPRSSLRDGNTVWIYNDGTLTIHPVVPVWKQDDRVFIRDGLTADNLIITSDLSTPVAGMRLALSEGTEESRIQVMDVKR